MKYAVSIVLCIALFLNLMPEAVIASENAFYDGFSGDAIDETVWTCPSNVKTSEGYKGNGLKISGNGKKTRLVLNKAVSAAESAEIEFLIKTSAGFGVGFVNGTKSRPVMKYSNQAVYIYEKATAAVEKSAVVKNNKWTKIRIRIDKNAETLTVITNDDVVSQAYSENFTDASGIYFEFNASYNSSYIDEVSVGELKGVADVMGFNVTYSESGFSGTGALFSGGAIENGRLSLKCAEEQENGKYIVIPENGTLEVDFDARLKVDYTARQNFIVTVKYADVGYGWFYFEYYGENGIRNTETVCLFDTGELKTAKFVISDGIFNKGANDFDLRLKTTKETAQITCDASKPTFSRDAVYITEISGAVSEKSSPFEINAETSATGNIFFDNIVAEFDVTINNLTSEEKNTDIVYSVYKYTVDEEQEPVLLTQRTKNYTVSAKERLNEVLKYYPEDYGLYLLEIRADDSETEQAVQIPFSKCLGNEHVNYTVGATTHLTRADADAKSGVELLGKAGMGLARENFSWFHYEKDFKENYGLTEEQIKFLSEAEENNIEVLAILGGNNPLYGGSYTGFVEDDYLDEFANYAKSIMQQKSFGNVKMVEVMNEPDFISAVGKTEITNGYQGRGEAYSKNVIAAYDAVKSVRDDAKVAILSLSGGVSNSNCKTFSDYTLAGFNGNRYLDTVSIHPYMCTRDAEIGEGKYTGRGKDSLAYIINYYRALVNGGAVTEENGMQTEVLGYTTKNKYNFNLDGDVWITEIGGSSARLPKTVSEMSSGSEYQQAIDNISEYNVIKSNSLSDKVWFYELADNSLYNYGFEGDGLRINEQEMNFGLLHSAKYSVPYAAKYAYLAISAINRLTYGATKCEEICHTKKGDYRFITKYTCPDRNVFMVRSTAENPEPVYMSVGNNYTCYDMLGNEIPADAVMKNGRWCFSKEPYYIVTGQRVNIDKSSFAAALYVGNEELMLSSDEPEDKALVTMVFEGNEEEASYELYLAEYLDGVLKRIEIIQDVVPVDGVYTKEIDLSKENKDKVKLFLFKNDGSLAPLCPSAELKRK